MAKNKTSKNNTAKVPFKERFEINKKKVWSSILVCGAVFILLAGSAIAAFCQNAAELSFTLKDFAPLYVGVIFAFCACFFVSMLLTKGVVHKILFVLYSALAFIGGIQNMISTFTFTGLMGDGTSLPPTITAQILNVLMWVAIAGGMVWLVFFFKDADFGRTIVSLGLVFVMVTQAGTTLIETLSYATNPDKRNVHIDAIKKEDGDNTDDMSHLTSLNMFEVSTKDNIIVFVLDRFSQTYFESFLSTDSAYIDELDGFTYYNDNIAKYPRTFPAVISMLTGMTYDYEDTRDEFMEEAYADSTFLKDLKNNGYKINLYIPKEDAYGNANVFNGMVSNTAETTGYSVNKADMLSNIFSLSSYFWTPEVFKTSNTISLSTLNSAVTLEGAAPNYAITNTSDAEHYDTFCEDGLSTQSSNGTFTFLHLRGCHSPLTIDENCEVFSEEGTNTYADVIRQTTGMFKFITEYIQQLKDLGLYEDATIIITGDHSALTSDKEPYTSSKLTALLVKESGKSGTPMKTSTAQVSQDNFLATIIKSAGIETQYDYGKAYSEIAEGETTTRTHYFNTLHVNPPEYYEYTIEGKGSDFENWKVTNQYTSD